MSTTTAGVRADVNYIRNPPGPSDAVLEFVTEDETQSTMVTMPGEPVWITNARGSTTDVDREGFVLVPHVSAVADFGKIQVDPAVDQQYIDEMTDLLVQVTGAAKVVFLGGGKKRFGESAVDELAVLKNAKPARYPHADNTDASATELAELFEQFVDDVDLTSCSRWAMYNMWRSVTPPPQDHPLAVCDARSLTPGDEVPVTALTVELGDVHVRHDTTSYVYNSAHRWHYFRDMTPDEVLVFKAHDTDTTRAGRVPHTAFTDPTCPPGTPTRASVEMRALALFD